VSWYRTTKSVIDKPIRIASQKIPAAAVMRSMAWADLTCMKNHATSSAFAVAITRLIAGFSAPSGTNALPSGVSRSAISAIQTATVQSVLAGRPPFAGMTHAMRRVMCEVLIRLASRSGTLVRTPARPVFAIGRKKFQDAC